jgi:hypothetical protein
VLAWDQRQWDATIDILVSDGQVSFLTSDSPVAMWGESPGPFGSTSLMMPDEVYLPLDPNDLDDAGDGSG